MEEIRADRLTMMIFSSVDADVCRKIRKMIFFILFLIAVLDVSGQVLNNPASARPMNSINLNLLGRGSNVALSYERIIPIKSYLFITGDLGAGYGKELELAIDSTEENIKPKYLTIPHQITVNIGKGRSFLEIGLGGTVAIGDVSPHYLLYPLAGYRFQPLTAGNMKVRVFINYVPGNHEEYRNIYFIPFGLSLGYCL